jgi:predicted DNA-binding transcriptional regulator YafY
VHPVDEARRAYAAPTLDLPTAGEPAAPPTSEARVLGARSVVVADAETLDRLLADAEVDLEAVSDTVAIADAEPERLRAALRHAGVPLLDDRAVAADAVEPALPTTPERAVGPKAVRTLLGRAVEERRQVWLRYFASSKAGATTERTVDPWALDADLLRGWCHLRRDERTFAVGHIGEAVMLAEAIEHEPG